MSVCVCVSANVLRDKLIVYLYVPVLLDYHNTTPEFQFNDFFSSSASPVGSVHGD